MNKFITFLLFSLCVLAAEAAPDFYLTGSFNNWRPDDPACRFTEAGGIYTLEVTALSQDFKITTPDWSIQYGCDIPIVYGQTYKCVMAHDGHNITLAEGAATDLTITFDYAAETVSIECRPTLYLIGDFNDWTPTSVYAFSRHDDVYTISVPTFTGSFSIVNRDRSVRFGTPETALKIGYDYPLADGGAPMTLPATDQSTGRVRITVTPDFKGEFGGVQEVISSTEGTEKAVYYDLKGLPADKPAHGMYIRRTATDTEKIIIR